MDYTKTQLCQLMRQNEKVILRSIVDTILSSEKEEGIELYSVEGIHLGTLQCIDFP